MKPPKKSYIPSNIFHIYSIYIPYIYIYISSNIFRMVILGFPKRKNHPFTGPLRSPGRDSDGFQADLCPLDVREEMRKTSSMGPWKLWGKSLIYTYLCIYVCIYMYVYIYINMRRYDYIHVCTDVYIYIYLHKKL